MSTQQLAVVATSMELVLVSFTLVVYDHVITFSQEVTFFWSGPWSASRILYLSIRYLALTQMFLALYVNIKTVDFLVGNRVSSFGVLQITVHRGNLALVTNCALAFTVLSLCQCVVTLRVWHLFHLNRFIRWLAVIVFIICTAGTIIIGGVRFDAIKNAMYELSETSTAGQQSPPFMFAIYVPALVVHTTMLFLTVYRLHVSTRILQQYSIIYRFVKEGIFMYTFAAGSLLYEITSLSMTEPNDISNYYSALMGEIAVAITAVSVCRAMLSSRSSSPTNPSRLLSHAELARVQWRRGANEGEIFVEVSDMNVLPPSRSLVVSVGNTEGEEAV
ncbi:hypothetical protein EDB19DRAFT_1907122 [Suillus lakei]|nr:hypothetical protein EDB19DRAFT_1907122 [Suillus lakei]